MRTPLLTVAALIAFAANSILCRMALGEHTIDAASFTTIRIVAGAAALLLAVLARRARPLGSWRSALALALYAAPFSFAYLSLGASTGALILFGSVQITMILAALRGGERLHAPQWGGVVAAIGGLVVLVLPGLRAPSPLGALAMAIAGAAWGFYSLRGRGATRPVAVTAGNFLRAAPMAALVSLVLARHVQLSGRGALLAALSGALTSGFGYVIWYAAVPGLSAARAATVQLAVPVIAAIGGVLVLGEHVTPRLAVSAVLILGGVLAVLRARVAAPAPARPRE